MWGRKQRQIQDLTRVVAAAAELISDKDEQIAAWREEAERQKAAYMKAQWRVENLAAKDGANDPLPSRRYIPPGGVS